jgi:dihydrodipicolinate synthase/N-acetylneuraminate lyase
MTPCKEDRTPDFDALVRKAQPLMGHGVTAAIYVVIYNSPYQGFATRADLFFALREQHPNLVGFKEFGAHFDAWYADWSRLPGAVQTYKP